MIESVLGAIVPRSGLSPIWICSCSASIVNPRRRYLPLAYDASPHDLRCARSVSIYIKVLYFLFIKGNLLVWLQHPSYKVSNL